MLKGNSFTHIKGHVYLHFSTLTMLPFLHADHIGKHVKYQHFTGLFSHLCFSLAPNAIHQWNINGLCIKTSFTWICWSDRLCSTPHYFYVQLFPFNTLTRYTYTCFQCSEGLPSHDVGLPFSKYVTNFLSAIHVPANINPDEIYYKNSQFSFTSRWELLSQFSPQGEWKLLVSIKYSKAVYHSVYS